MSGNMNDISLFCIESHRESEQIAYDHHMLRMFMGKHVLSVNSISERFAYLVQRKAIMSARAYLAKETFYFR